VFLYVDPRLNKRVELGLGGFPFVSLTQARAKAAQARGFLNEMPPRSPKEVWATMTRESKLPTFSEFSEEFFAHMNSQWVAGHLETVRRHLLTHCKILAGIRIDRISHADVFNDVSAYATQSPGSAPRMLGSISQVIDFAVARGHLPHGSANPAKWTKETLKLLPKAVEKNHAAMAHAEVPGYVATLRAMRQKPDGTPYVPAYAMEFIILTGTRLSETSGAVWSEFDLTNKVWNIPAERMKAGDPHIVPLTDAMVDILDAMQAIKTSEFVFPSNARGAPFNNKTFERLLEKTYTKTKLTTHGFRSAFSTWSHNINRTSHEIVERALAHKAGSKVSQTYWREQPVDEHRELFAAWNNYLADKPATNVVPLRAA
jgi:integrase